MVGGRSPRLRLEEIVVDDVQRNCSESQPGQPGFGSKARDNARGNSPLGVRARMSDRVH